jgi:autotransporter-associated beta strand protein
VDSEGDLSMRLAAKFNLAIVLAAAFCPTAANADPPASTGSDWRVVFADEFSGTTVDTVKWATQYQWGPTHNHAAYMEADNVVLDGGVASLVATRESAPAGKQFTSGVLSSHNTFRVSEGYIEARIKMPMTRGSWPAFWMLSSGWPPEIDIMEDPLFVGQTTNDTYSVNNFWPGTGPPSDFLWVDRNIDLSADYHNYGLQLDSTGLRFFFDGQQVKFSSYKPDFQNMYLIFNYAVGGWPVPGSTDANPLPPSTTDWPIGHVDQTQAEWIRVWERAPANATSTWTFNSASSGSWDTSANWSGAVPNFDRQDVVLPTLAGRSAMELRWNNSRTVGDLTLNGDTAYTLGQDGGGVESLMLADETDNFVNIVASGTGGHVFNTRLDLWSNVAIHNDAAAPLIFNGDLVGQTRQLTPNGRYIGGQLRLTGAGTTILNGNGYYQRDTLISEGAIVEINGQLYADANYLSDTDVTVDLGATLVVGSLDAALGGLPASADRMLVNAATVRLKSSGNLTRGFTIGGGGATIAPDAGVSVRLTGAEPIASNAGGDFIMAGDGSGRLQKSLGGAGNVIKTGGGTWVMTMANSYTGETIIEQGLLSVSGSTGLGSTTVEVGGELNGTGEVLGDLVVRGMVSPGTSIGSLSVLGDFFQEDAGVLNIEIQGTAIGAYDTLNIAGAATLAGELNIALAGGFVPMVGDFYSILGAASVTNSLELVGDAAGFSLLTTESGLALYFGPLLPGDYNEDGKVDATDYDVWKIAYGTEATPAGSGADGNGDGLVNAADYTVWRNHLGGSVLDSGLLAAPVPEPRSAWVLAQGLIVAWLIYRRAQFSPPAGRKGKAT